MKKAFTLIELLVVIAIIAILAAILFPVFAQAKAAAKKSASISNQKQSALGIVMYGADNDDMFPRNDDCQPGTALNPALNVQPFNPTGVGCTTGAFFYRMNHFSWQKWVMPYMKNVDIFFNPARGRTNVVTPSCPGGTWAGCGQITGSYLLNTSITGQLNTYGNPTRPGAFRNSWLGGSMTSIPNPSATAMLLESGNAQIGVAPVALAAADTGTTQTAFPPAIRELWAYEYKIQNAAYNGNLLGNPDENRAAFQGVVVGHTDGSAKFYQVERFLSLTPTAAEYGVNATPSQGWNGTPGNLRGFTGGTIRISNNPNLFINYPLWGLGQ